MEEILTLFILYSSASDDVKKEIQDIIKESESRPVSSSEDS